MMLSKISFSQYHLPEFPLTVLITHRDTLRLFDVLVLNGGEEAVEEAHGEETGRLLGCRRIGPNLDALTVFLYPYGFICRMNKSATIPISNYNDPKVNAYNGLTLSGGGASPPN